MPGEWDANFPESAADAEDPGAGRAIQELDDELNKFGNLPQTVHALAGTFFPSKARDVRDDLFPHSRVHRYH